MEVISTENAEHYVWGGRCDGWHLAQTPQMSVIEEKVPSGCFEARHYHVRSEQFFNVISGAATIEVEGRVYELNENHGLHVQAGKPHQLHNRRECDLRFIVLSVPPSHGERVEA